MANFGWSLPPGITTLPGENPQYCAACWLIEDLWDDEWDEASCEKDGYLFCSPECAAKGPQSPPEEHD